MKNFRILFPLVMAGLWASSSVAQTQAPVYMPPSQPSKTAYQAEPVIPPYDEYGNPNPDAFEWSGFALGLNLGTLGIGIEANAYLSEYFNFRAGINLFDFTYKDTIEDIDFDMDVTFLTAGLLLDLLPFDGNFRITGGVLFNNSDLTLDGSPRVPTEIGDNEYTPEQIGTITGEVTFDDFAPYIGIGYGNPVRPDTSIGFSVDFGVMFQAYDLFIESDGTAANDPAFQSDLRILENDIDDELSKINIYPVLTFGLSYHF
jgi:hypothetical protein